MRLYRLALFIASILLVDAAYLSGNLSISYDPKPTLMFSTFAVKVDAKPNDKGVISIKWLLVRHVLI